MHNAELLWQAVDSCSTTFTTSTHLEKDVRVGSPAVRRAHAQTRVQFTSVPQVTNAQKHCFQHAGLLIINELLHHWQISLISQGRACVWVHVHTRPQTHTCAGECVWTCMCSHPHAFYHSNLTGKSMIWLANRELMQSRGLPSLSPSSLIYLMSLSSSSSSSHFLSFFPRSCFLLLGTRKQQLHTERLMRHTRQAETWARDTLQGLYIFWRLVILFL